MAKQDHRTYTRPQVDFLCKQAGLDAVRRTARDYAVAVVMCLMGEGRNKEQINRFMTDVDSLFDSLYRQILSFEDCVEDIRKNTSIDLSSPTPFSASK